MTNTIEYDLIIVGSGLAGLRATIQAARRNSKIRIAVVSKVQVMRSHSVSAEGGTAAVLFPDEGDSIESHIYDTVKGSDFLADQDAAERLCKEMPDEIYQLEHWVCHGPGEKMANLVNGLLVVIVFLGQHMHQTKLDFLKCKRCMIHVKNLIILNFSTSGL